MPKKKSSGRKNMIFSEMAKQVRKVPSLTYSDIQGAKPTKIFCKSFVNEPDKALPISMFSICFLTKPGFPPPWLKLFRAHLSTTTFRGENETTNKKSPLTYLQQHSRRKTEHFCKLLSIESNKMQRDAHNECLYIYPHKTGIFHPL